ncbi:MAG: ABC transporter permease [SAR324 cluster bacterium]|uniref:ABC transporter permease n=1 Tax=SAR324 cluster bacterium TaxID=2024889 RepID=A0A2D6YKE0_9DELT|nr:ABC transporter permease [SAR324 cluster bacterium]
MSGYIVGRFLQIPITLGIILIISFILIQAAPGDPVAALAGDYVTREYRERIIRHYGLDQSLWKQGLRYFQNVLQGDFGDSYYFKASVAQVIAERLPQTLLLVIPSVIFSSLIGIPLGFIAAKSAHPILSSGIPLWATLLNSLPIFWLAYLLILTFSVSLEWFPTKGMVNVRLMNTGIYYFLDVLHHLALPLLTMVLSQLAQILLLTRARLREEIKKPYFRTALSKGLSQQKATTHHALPNAMLPVITVIGSRFGFLITGAILTETVFAWPGLGRLMILAIEVRDYPLVLGIIFMLSIIVMVLNLLTDVAYSVLDPRIDFAGNE